MKDKVVLYIDDDSDDLFILESIFKEIEGAPQLVCLKESEKAIEYILTIKRSDKELCLILLDINMHKLDGKALAQMIKKHEELNHIAIAFISTSSSPNDKGFAAQLDAALFTKANSLEGMKSLVQAIIEQCVLVRSK